MAGIDPIALSQKIMRLPSVTPKEAGALDALQVVLEAMGFKCHRLIFSEPGTEDVDNLYARLGDAQPNLCFAGHMDVVPVGDRAQWEVDPFGAEVINGKLYGRGASDMKTAIAAWVAAISRFLVNNKGTFSGSLSLLITCDEEGPSINGTRKALEWLKEKKEILHSCVVGEPTSDKVLADVVKIGRRGTANFFLTVRGIQGHVAYPQLADNPVPRLVKILSRLDARKLDSGTEFFDPSNLEITSVDVGNPTTNIIPATATARFNIRFNDKHTGEKLVKWVHEECAAVTSQYLLESTVGGEAFLSQKGFLTQVVEGAVTSITGKAPVFSTTGGTSDARFIRNFCPVVELGVRNETAHKINENVPVADIEKLTDIYSQIISRFFSGV